MPDIGGQMDPAGNASAVSTAEPGKCPGRCKFATEFIVAGPKQRSACDCCNGVFGETSKFLCELKVGQQDKLGYKVTEIYCGGEDYAVYRSTHGVHVHFADCHARERQQRRNLLAVQPRIATLRYLSSQLARDMPLSRGRGGFYDLEIAEAIALALEGRCDDADRILANGQALAQERLQNENRIAYLVACLLSAMALIGAFWWLGLGAGDSDGQWRAYATASCFGAAGAAFSIGARVNSLALAPFQQSLMNYAMGALRVLIGATAGAVILLICNGSIIGEPVVKVLEKFTDADTLSILTAKNWEWIGLLGLLGGFAERMVPNLLGTIETKAASQVDARPA